MRSSALLALAALLAAGCSSSSTPATSGAGGAGATPITRIDLPKGFLWGSATAGFQVEKGLGDTDWGAWAAMPDGKIQGGSKPDDGPDAFAHVDGDIALMQAAGLGAYRFSIELARIYPTRAAFDADQPSAEGLAAYDGLIAKLRAAKIVPLVTLHHFVWPSWMSDPSKPTQPQGFERADAASVFEAWCTRMGKRYGKDVDWWITINEPTVEASVGYLAGIWPPGVSDVERMVGVMKKQVELNARCYDALHAADHVDADGDGKAALVSIAKHDRVYEPVDPTSPDDVAAAEHSRRFWNQWFVDAIVKGDVDENFDDVLGAGDRIGDPALRGRADYLGINYYGVSRVAAHALQFPHMGTQPAQFGLQDGRPKNDLGWSIYPEGFGKVLDEVAPYGLPIVVTENGIADAKDANRSRFLLEHVFEMGKAMKRGVDVVGYFHWSLVDNFEWASGFCPKFGLYRVDLASPARTRTPTKAVAVFKELASTGTLAQSTIDALPPYASGAASCASF
jgi:beta-glucosidase